MYNVYTYKSNWWGFIGKRVLIAVLVFFVITLLVSFAVNRNPSYFSLPPVTSIEQIEEYVHSQGWDTPLIIRYFRWMGDFFTGEWGNSLVHRMPVKDMLY
jgi:peptide/nickel transport system permease protein